MKFCLLCWFFFFSFSFYYLDLLFSLYYHESRTYNTQWILSLCAISQTSPSPHRHPHTPQPRGTHVLPVFTVTISHFRIATSIPYCRMLSPFFVFLSPLAEEQSSLAFALFVFIVYSSIIPPLFSRMSRADLTVRRRAHPHDILFCFFTIFGFRLAVARVSCRAFPSLSSPPPPASLHIHPSTRTQHTTTHAYTHIHQITLGFPLVLYDITHGFFRAKGKPTRTRGGGSGQEGF
jgi:hypothetical protein